MGDGDGWGLFFVLCWLSCVGMVEKVDVISDDGFWRTLISGVTPDLDF